MKEQAYNKIKTKNKTQELNEKGNLMKSKIVKMEAWNQEGNLASEEIVSLKILSQKWKLGLWTWKLGLYKVAKQIWDRFKLLMQGTELSYQERECKLYNEFDKIASIKGEILHDYYMRFAQLINDIHIIRMTMHQVKVNTKFLNGLQPEWSKFVTDVKLAKSMYTTSYDQLYAYLSQHEGHENEVRLMNQRVIVQQVQRRQIHGYASNGLKSNATASWPKRPRNSAWFKDKLILIEAQESSQVLDEEQLSFLANSRVAVGQDTQTIMPLNAAFQTDDLDAFD
ncbi:hypothetical protein Tco_0811146 [Tanacetum coccineum]